MEIILVLMVAMHKLHTKLHINCHDKTSLFFTNASWFYNLDEGEKASSELSKSVISLTVSFGSSSLTNFRKSTRVNIFCH